MRNWLLISATALALSSTEGNAGPCIEYRFKVPDGVAFKWRDGKVERLASQPFMITSDFAHAMAMKSTNPNAPASFEIDIVHNELGTRKYRAITKFNSPREYCMVFNKVVLQGYAIIPRFASLYEQGGTIYGPFSRSEAMDLTAQINKLLR